MRAITVCVDFSDVLALTLCRNAPHFDQVVVVSAPDDRETAAVVASVPNAELFTTDAFYRDGAVFNKGAAMELGLDHLGRHRDEWLCIFDADTLMPGNLLDRIAGLPPGNIYSPRRRLLADPSQWHEGISWRSLPTARDEECAGYFQLFHSRDPVLRETPWYGTDWRHAGGCDSDLAARWSMRRRIRLKWHVLHFGVDGQNWCGRVMKRVDGSTPPQAEERAKQLAEIKRVREANGNNDHEKLSR